MELSCDDLHCDLERLVPRARLAETLSEEEQSLPNGQDTLPSPPVRVFVGRMESGDKVIRSDKHRRELVERGVIGVGLEGASIWDQLPCIAVKGVSDYADGHKNKEWQDYAAATAASVAKAVLEHYTAPTEAGRNPLLEEDSFDNSGSGSVSKEPLFN